MTEIPDVGRRDLSAKVRLLCASSQAAAREQERMFMFKDRTSANVPLVIDSPHGQAWMRGETQGVALPGVNVGDFRRMPIPVPPIAEQVRIVARVSELRRLCAELRLHMDRSIATRAALADALIDEALAA